MNKSGWVILITFIAFIGLFSITCKKEEEGLIDKYLGKWDFEVINTRIISELNSNTILTSTADTIHYEGEITPGSVENEILVQYTDFQTLKLSINYDGQVSQLCFHPSYCQGMFLDNNTFLYKYSSRVNNINTTTGSITEIKGEKI